MDEVSPCKSCEHLEEDRNKHPDCVECIDGGTPGKYAKYIEKKESGDLFVEKRKKTAISLKNIKKLEKKIEKVAGARDLPYGKTQKEIQDAKIEAEVQKCIKKVCKVSGITVKDLKNNKTRRDISWTRCELIVLLRQKYNLHQNDIAEKLNITRSAVVYHLGRHEHKINFINVPIGELLNSKKGLIDRLILAAEEDMRTPENQILYYIKKGIGKGVSLE